MSTDSLSWLCQGQSIDQESEGEYCREDEPALRLNVHNDGCCSGGMGSREDALS